MDYAKAAHSNAVFWCVQKIAVHNANDSSNVDAPLPSNSSEADLDLIPPDCRHLGFLWSEWLNDLWAKSWSSPSHVDPNSLMCAEPPTILKNLFGRESVADWLHFLDWPSMYDFAKDTQSATPEIVHPNEQDGAVATSPLNGRKEEHLIKVIAGLLNIAGISKNESAAEVARQLETRGGQIGIDSRTLGKTLRKALLFRKVG